MYNIHEILAVECAKDRYSNSMLDLATVCCFFALQDIKLLPRNTYWPEVEQRSSTLLVQSALEKQVKVILAYF